MKLSVLRELSLRFAPPSTPEELQTIQETLRGEGIDFQNFYQELEMSDPFVETHRDVTYSNTQLNLHSHTFYEMLFCLNDCSAQYLVGADRYLLRRGDIVLVPPGVSHRPLLPEKMEEPYERYVLWLSQEFVETCVGMFGLENIRMEAGTLLRTRGTKWELLGELFRRGVWESENTQPGWQAAVVGNTITLLSLMGRGIRDRTAAVLKAEKPDLLNEVLAYIKSILSRKITLEETAKQFYVSTSTVTQLFRQKMGTSFYHCVTQHRLIAAKTLIEQGLTLEEVSHAVGFADYSSFYRAFKKEYGITPRQYTQL